MALVIERMKEEEMEGGREDVREKGRERGRREENK